MEILIHNESCYSQVPGPAKDNISFDFSLKNLPPNYEKQIILELFFINTMI